MNQHQLLIGIGSNIDPEFHTREAYRLLHEHFSDVKVSPVYECPAQGFEGPAFYNWVAKVSTNQTLTEIYQLFKQLEEQYGRKDWHKEVCSRTMDLDILCFDNLVCHTPLVLPRPEILKRAFVLKPLADMVPDDIHPVLRKTYIHLWQQFDQTSQPIRSIDFKWSETKA